MSNEEKIIIPPSQLLEETKRLLDARRGSWANISRETGIDYHFITRVSNGRIADPGIIRLEKLHTYMTAN